MPPSCSITAVGTNTAGKRYIQVTTSDSGSGLGTIVVLIASNMNVTLPTFTSGTHDPQVVVGTRIVSSQASQLSIRVTDVAGNSTTCDPVLLDVTIPTTTQSQTTSLDNLPAAENQLVIHNDTPGLSGLRVTVNGQTYTADGLQDGDVRALDLSSAMTSGTYHLRLDALGPPGASATLLLADLADAAGVPTTSPPTPASADAGPAAVQLALLPPADPVLVSDNAAADSSDVTRDGPEPLDPLASPADPSLALSLPRTLPDLGKVLVAESVTTGDDGELWQHRTWSDSDSGATWDSDEDLGPAANLVRESLVLDDAGNLWRMRIWTDPASGQTQVTQENLGAP